MSNLQQQFSQIDIYLFDQLLRGRITRGMRVLDAGCGSGRNLVYLLREGYEVFGFGCRSQGRLPTSVVSQRSLRQDFPRTIFESNPSNKCRFLMISPTESLAAPSSTSRAMMSIFMRCCNAHGDA